MVFCLLSFYIVGVFGSLVGCGSYLFRYKRSVLKSRWIFFMLASFAPIINYKVMWLGLNWYYLHESFIK